MANNGSNRCYKQETSESASKLYCSSFHRGQCISRNADTFGSHPLETSHSLIMAASQNPMLNSCFPHHTQNPCGSKGSSKRQHIVNIITCTLFRNHDCTLLTASVISVTLCLCSLHKSSERVLSHPSMATLCAKLLPEHGWKHRRRFV